MPKSAILTVRPGPFVVSKQFLAAISRWINLFSSKYLQPFATSIAQVSKSLMIRGEGRSWNTENNRLNLWKTATEKMKLCGHQTKVLQPFTSNQLISIWRRSQVAEIKESIESFTVLTINRFNWIIWFYSMAELYCRRNVILKSLFWWSKTYLPLQGFRKVPQPL